MPPSPRYPYVIFDADGTLFDFDSAMLHAMRETCGDHGLAFTDELYGLYQEINHRWWRRFETGEVTATELRVGRFREFLGEVDGAVDPEGFSSRYLRRLSEHHELMPGAAACVEALAPHCTLLLLTNGLAEVQVPRFERAPICRHFRDIVISGVVGVAKPDSAIFEIAMERLGNPAKRDVIIVGDSLTSDMAGGSAYGIGTCWFNPGGRAPALEVDVRFEIKDLGDVVGIVEVRR